MKLSATFPAALTSLVLLVGCGKSSVTPLSNDIVATVDGKPIPRSALEAELARGSRNGKPVEPQAALEELLQRERLVARALRLGLDHDPEVRRSFQSVLIAKLKERELEPKLRSLAVTDDDVRALSESEANREIARPQVRLAVLRLQVSPKASATRLKATQARLEEARELARKLPPDTIGFGSLALDYSDDDATRHRGGDLGWLDADPSRYHFDQAMLAAGFDLKTPGEISPVIQGRDGLYLVRSIARRDAKEVAASARKSADTISLHRAQIAERGKLEMAFAEETRQLIPVTVNAAAVGTLAVRDAAAPALPR